MLELFAPYSFFISLIISISFNLLLIFRTNSNWIVVIIANVLLSVVLNLMGLDQFDFLTRIINTIMDLIISIMDALIDGAVKIVTDFFGSLFDGIANIVDKITPWWYECKIKRTPLYTGGFFFHHIVPNQFI